MSAIQRLIAEELHLAERAGDCVAAVLQDGLALYQKKRLVPAEAELSAGFAELATRCYAATKFGDDCKGADPAQRIGALMADLLLYARSKGIDIDELIEEATASFDEEVAQSIELERAFIN